MSKVLSFSGRTLRIRGSDEDEYYQQLPDEGEIGDNVLLAVRPFVAEDSVCMDVGANLGLFTLPLAVMVPRGRIYAFEPSPASYAYLEENLAENDVTNVDAYCSAVSDATGVIQLSHIPYFTAGSFARSEESPSPGAIGRSELLEVPAITLDDFSRDHALSRLDLVKIDVEGGELAVLRGARKTLAHHQPIVILEFNTLCLDLFRGIPSRSALRQVQDIFPHVFIVDRVDGSLSRLETDREVHKFLFENGIYGRVDNLLCSFRDLPVSKGYEQVCIAPCRPPSSDAAVDERTELERALQEARSEVARVRGEIQAMRSTASWRITGPLRLVRGLIRSGGRSDDQEGTQR